MPFYAAPLTENLYGRFAVIKKPVAFHQGQYAQIVVQRFRCTDNQDAPIVQQGGQGCKYLLLRIPGK